MAVGHRPPCRLEIGDSGLLALVKIMQGRVAFVTGRLLGMLPCLELDEMALGPANAFLLGCALLPYRSSSAPLPGSGWLMPKDVGHDSGLERGVRRGRAGAGWVPGSGTSAGTVRGVGSPATTGTGPAVSRASLRADLAKASAQCPRLASHVRQLENGFRKPSATRPGANPASALPATSTSSGPRSPSWNSRSSACAWNGTTDRRTPGRPLRQTASSPCGSTPAHGGVASARMNG